MEVLQSRPDVLNIIGNVAKSQGLKQHKIVEVQTNQKGQGFLGEIFMLKIKDVQANKELNLVLKSAFKASRAREFLPVRTTFQNEVYFYSEVYQTFENFAKSNGISTPVQLVPRCYEVSLVDECELLVMENLKTQGFESFDRKAQVDHDHVKIIFEAYGRYHGYSYAFKDQHPEEFKKLASNTRDIFRKMLDNPSILNILNGSADIVHNLLVPGRDDELLKRFEKYNSENILQTFEAASTENCDHAVLIHGDCWSNNMLFKYKETDDGRKLVDIRLVDWQLVKLGSPVCDLSYCLYSGASRQVLDKLDYYLKIYFDAMSAMIRKLGSDPEKLISFNVLKQHWKIYAKYGLIMSFMDIKINLTNNEDIRDVKDLEKSDVDKTENNRFLEMPYDKKLFNIRIRDLLEHSSEIDAL